MLHTKYNGLCLAYSLLYCSTLEQAIIYWEWRAFDGVLCLKREKNPPDTVFDCYNDYFALDQLLFVW